MLLISGKAKVKTMKQDIYKSNMHSTWTQISWNINTLKTMSLQTLRSSASLQKGQNYFNLNHRMGWLGRGLKDHLVPTSLSWAGTAFT